MEKVFCPSPQSCPFTTTTYINVSILRHNRFSHPQHRRRRTLPLGDQESADEISRMTPPLLPTLFRSLRESEVTAWQLVMAPEACVTMMTSFFP